MEDRATVGDDGLRLAPDLREGRVGEGEAREWQGARIGCKSFRKACKSGQLASPRLA